MPKNDRAHLVKQVGQMYKRGESIRSIATALGKSYGFVHTAVVESQVKMRPRGGPNRKVAR